YRWQRQPAESMSFARNFPIGKERRGNLPVPAAVQKKFKQLFFLSPATGNHGGPGRGGAGAMSTAPPTPNSASTGGFGYINTTNPLGGAAQPRSGQAILRLTF